MITVKCPECGAGLHVGFKGESKKGWKICKACGKPSYFTITEGISSSAKSLHSMILESKNRVLLAQALNYIVQHEEAYLDDIYFNVGMKVKPDLEVFESYNLLKRIGNHYVIEKGLGHFVESYIAEFLPKKQKSMLDKMF